MFVMLKSKAISENQKSHNESLETSLLKLIHTITHPGFFRKKHKAI